MHMKKKTLLLTLLALAIVTSLTAGTLAIYTKSVDLGAVVEIKKFAFEAAGKIESGAKSINLAPKESMSYKFEVTNYDDKGTSEVPLLYTIYADFTDATKQMPGLYGALYMGDKLVAETKEGELEWKGETPETKQTAHGYVLKLTWAGEGEKFDILQSEAGFVKPDTKGLNITVFAVQKI